MRENDYLKLGKSEHYRGNISSIDIERFLIGLISREESTLDTKIEISINHGNLGLKEIATNLDINYETARKLAKMGWFDSVHNSNDIGTIKKYSKEKVQEFKNKYMIVASLAKHLRANPTNLVEKLSALDITPIHGPHIDSTPINIFLKKSLQDIGSNDLDMIHHYSTRTGRPEDKLELPAKSINYYSLKDAARHLEISPNKVAVLVQKGILKKDLNNPLSIQVQASSLLNIKKKLNNEEYIPYLDAANQLNCPINWMKKYWCETGFLNIEDLVYWKLIHKNELIKVLKLKEEFLTGAEASSILGMRHSHITNLQNQGLVKPFYFGKTESKIRLFRKEDILKLKYSKEDISI